MLHCVAERVLPCVAVCCSMCIVSQYDAVCCSALKCVAVCCRVLQCVAVCCGVVQCVAVRCSAFSVTNAKEARSLVVNAIFGASFGVCVFGRQ